MTHVLWKNEENNLFTVVPSKQLRKQSLHIVSSNKEFNRWSAENHRDSYLFMQHIAQAWTSDFTNQYLIYGKINSKTFKWEMVPYQQCRTGIGRVIQQLQVLWRTVFGGISVSDEEQVDQFDKHALNLNKFRPNQPDNTDRTGSDSFCQNSTIESQWVITGNKVNVLFNYAPIGFGGEKLHFLVVPKQHREAFTDVTQEEYCESLELTTKLVDHFTENRKNIKNVYLLNKTGKDAGQTVNHWHLHIIFSTNTAQDFWGKITVIKNILFGSSPMRKSDLANRVTELRNELAG